MKKQFISIALMATPLLAAEHPFEQSILNDRDFQGISDQILIDDIEQALRNSLQDFTSNEEEQIVGFLQEIYDLEIQEKSEKKIESNPNINQNPPIDICSNGLIYEASMYIKKQYAKVENNYPEYIKRRDNIEIEKGILDQMADFTEGLARIQYENQKNKIERLEKEFTQYKTAENIAELFEVSIKSLNLQDKLMKKFNVTSKVAKEILDSLGC